MKYLMFTLDYKKRDTTVVNTELLSTAEESSCITLARRSYYLLTQQ